MAAEPGEAGGRGARLARGLGAGLLFLALALRRVVLPSEVATTQIDACGQRCFGPFFWEGARAGVDYVYTAGPLGFLYGTTYDPSVFGARVVWGALFAACWALGLGLTWRATAGARPRALLLLVALVLPFAPDAATSFLLLSLVIWLLRRPPPAWALALSLALALTLSLVKFTYLLASALGAAAVLASLALQPGPGRSPARAAGWGLGGLSLAAGLWLALGQRLGDLPAYLATSLEISRGYSEAMAFSGHGLFPGCAALGCLALAAAALLRAGTRPRQELLASLAVLAWTALAFKHGSVREDGHLLGTFVFLSLAPFLCWRDLGAFSPGRRRALAGCVALALGCGLIGGHLFCSWTFAEPLPRWPGRAAAEVAQQGRALLAPERLRARLEAQRLRARQEHALPRARAAVGGASVDVLNVQHGLLYLNDLRRSQRPVLHGYLAYSPSLARHNVAHLAGPRAPGFVLLDGLVIDDHLPTLDDGAALVEVLRRYELVLVERGLSLLRRRAAEPPPRELLWERTLDLEQELSLPAPGPGLIQLELDLQPSPLGRLRRLAWRAPRAELVVTLRDGRALDFRLIPGLARAGFLIDPLPLEPADLAALANGEEVPRVASLRVAIRPRRRRYFATRYRVRAWRVPLPPPPRLDLPAAASRALAAELGARATVPPEVSVQLAHEPRLGRVVQVHAPGRLELPVPLGAARLEGTFGIRPGAHESGRTDGVGFAVAVGSAPLWSRRLDPLARAGDRGPQTFSLELPAGARRLELVTDPGPTSSWDWSYWSRLRFLDAAGARVEAE